MKRLKSAFRELWKYPSAVAGLTIIGLLLAVSIYTIITIPYREAIRLWRGGESVWYQNPKYAPPAWLNFFYSKKLPVSFAVSTADGSMTKTTEDKGGGITNTDITYSFDYNADGFPQELILYFTAKYQSKLPFVSMTWVTPDGREVRLGDMAIEHKETFRASQDQKLQKRLHTTDVMEGLFSVPDSDPPEVLKGTYQLNIHSVSFEEGADLSAQLVQHGALYGLAGTDFYRRDLMLPLLWGTPVALMFGLLAALGTAVLTMIIAAVGTWYGGWLDNIIQRVTEINLVLPFLAILIMIGTFYSRSIWVILGVTILLSIFGAGIKTYRAIFLQAKEAGYIEAARAYGASNMRIVFAYLIPRMVPTLIPALVAAVPTFVFLEASLAVLGLGDPVLPTWGKVIENAFTDGALYHGHYYWVLEPAALLMFTGLGFALLGFALDRIFNPKLRGM
jgi:peptide/nickel transport system permease protein